MAPTTTVAPTTSSTGAPPVTAPPATAPLNVNESTRIAAQADLDAAKRSLADAQKAEALARQKATAIDATLAGLEAKRQALAGDEQQVADRLEATRTRLRTAAISTYVTGGRETIANQVVQADSVDQFARNKVYGTAVLDTQQRLVSGYRADLQRATASTSDLGRQIDRAKADQGLIAQEIEGLAALRAQREGDVAQKQLLTNLVTAAAPVLPSDIPALILDAYLKGAAAANRRTPGCRIHWTALAAIGRTESGNGRSGGAALTLNGDLVPRILGPRLDGNGFALILDTDGGQFDGDTQYDRAVGPMQFIPSTWRTLGEDGNGDGIEDPNNIYDAATAAAMYLCRARQGLDSAANLYGAALSYNHSDSYATTIVTRAREYSALTMPGLPPGPTYLDPVPNQQAPSGPTTTALPPAQPAGTPGSGSGSTGGQP